MGVGGGVLIVSAFGVISGRSPGVENSDGLISYLCKICPQSRILLDIKEVSKNASWTFVDYQVPQSRILLDIKKVL